MRVATIAPLVEPVSPLGCHPARGALPERWYVAVRDAQRVPTPDAGWSATISSGVNLDCVQLRSDVGADPAFLERAGLAPEVVAHPMTGFVCDTVDHVAQAVARVAIPDRPPCLRHVEQRLSGSPMAPQYERRSTRRSLPAGGADWIRRSW